MSPTGKWLIEVYGGKEHFLMFCATVPVNRDKQTDKQTCWYHRIDYIEIL